MATSTDQLPRTLARAAAAMVAVVLTTGCGAYSSVKAAPAGATGRSVSTPSVSPSPAPATIAPSPAVAPPTPSPTTLHFELMAVGEPVSGGVTVTARAGGYTIEVTAAGLPPGSAHSVHLHFGNCPSTGVHIITLGTLRADAQGAGSMIATMAGGYIGDGRFVIVYVGPSAGPLAACSQLSGRL